MTERQRRLFSLFKLAIESEQSAQKLYQDAMALCDDKELKDIIEGFYGEEVKHERVLLEKYRQYRERFAAEGED
jgi:rubrerythrin